MLRALKIVTCLCLAVGLRSGAAAQNVTTYHNGAARHGAYIAGTLTLAAAAGAHLDTGFAGKVKGNVYAQPLFWKAPGAAAGEIIVATEANVVAALNATTGATLWSRTLGTPVPRSSLPCGNIIPEGITGTPAIDPATGVIYLDTLVDTKANGPRHLIYALSASTGATQPHWPIDLQATLAAKGDSFDSLNQGNRSAVLLLNGNVYLTFAGRYGDCGAYRGTVVQVSETAATIGGFWQTRAAGGGIWQQGGATTDGAHLYVTTGNTMGASTWLDGEAVVRLAPGLAHSTATSDYFTPSDWQTLDDKDLDLGGTGAILIDAPGASGAQEPRILALGKDGNAYLIDRNRLGGIGGQLATVAVAGGEIITGPAVYAAKTQTLVAFRNPAGKTCSGSSLSMLNVTATAMNEVWCATLNGNGAPIVTTTDGTNNAIVWIFGAEGDGLLHGFDALTGKVVFSGGGPANAVQGVRHFATPIAAEGRLYIAANGQIFAFVY